LEILKHDYFEGTNLSLVLHSVKSLLEKCESFKENFERAGGLEILENLQHHKVDEVYAQAKEILENHFELDSIEQSMMIPVH